MSFSVSKTYLSNLENQKIEDNNLRVIRFFGSKEILPEVLEYTNYNLFLRKVRLTIRGYQSNTTDLRRNASFLIFLCYTGLRLSGLTRTSYTNVPKSHPLYMEYKMRPDRSVKDKYGRVLRTDHSNMSDVFKDVLNKFVAPKSIQDRKKNITKEVKKAGG